MKKMKTRIIIFLLMFFGITFDNGVVVSAQDKKTDKNISSKNKVLVPDLKDWPQASQKAAREIMDKYGVPSEVTKDMLIWNNNGIWLKTIVYKEEVKHNFPSPHTDVVEQWINYGMLPDKFDPLAKFDGSITTNRTNGTISSRCDREAMNFLALNLAHEIVMGVKSVTQARFDYATQAQEFNKGEKPSYTQKLIFNSDKSAPDPDRAYDLEMKIGMDGTDGK
jgi:hypothetical protein